jgi:hypothetical protein
MQQHPGQKPQAQEAQDVGGATIWGGKKARSAGRRFGSGLAGVERWSWHHWLRQSGGEERRGVAGAASAPQAVDPAWDGESSDAGASDDARISAMQALAVCPLPMSLAAEDSQLLQQLVAASHTFDASGQDAERNCWLAVHQHAHGVLPSEYDIREVPEALYLAVLALRRSQAGEG